MAKLKANPTVIPDGVDKSRELMNDGSDGRPDRNPSQEPIFDKRTVGVDWTQEVTEGTKIAEFSINGQKQDIYAPSGGGGTVVDVQVDDVSVVDENDVAHIDGLPKVEDVSPTSVPEFGILTYHPQVLTDGQKVQARENIGAASSVGEPLIVTNNGQEASHTYAQMLAAHNNHHPVFVYRADYVFVLVAAQNNTLYFTAVQTSTARCLSVDSNNVWSSLTNYTIQLTQDKIGSGSWASDTYHYPSTQAVDNHCQQKDFVVNLTYDNGFWITSQTYAATRAAYDSGVFVKLFYTNMKYWAYVSSISNTKLIFKGVVGTKDIFSCDFSSDGITNVQNTLALENASNRQQTSSGWDGTSTSKYPSLKAIDEHCQQKTLIVHTTGPQSSGVYPTDHTFAEILSAINAGTEVLVEGPAQASAVWVPTFHLSIYCSSTIQFQCTWNYGSGSIYLYDIIFNSERPDGTYMLRTRTIVSSISAGTSVDANLPTVSAVRNFVNPKLSVSEVKSDGSVVLTDGVGSTQEFLPRNLVSTWGIVSHTLNYSQRSDGSYYPVITNPVWGWISNDKIREYTVKGATFNSTTGYFELNELTDLSYEDMVRVDSIPAFNNNAYSTNRLYLGARSRTNFYDIYSSDWECNPGGAFCYGSKLEVLKVWSSTSTTGNISYFLCLSRYLRKVIGVITFVGTSHTIDGSSFTHLYSLESIHLKSLYRSLRFTHSQRLEPESVHFMIDGARDCTSSPITITLHQTAFTAWEQSEYHAGDIQICTDKGITVQVAS